jgi:hypothetical protein
MSDPHLYDWEKENGELRERVKELEAQVRVMRGIIVQAMLQNNREQPAETGYARNPVAYSTSSTTKYGQYGNSNPNYGTAIGQNINNTIEQNISDTLLDAMKPLTAFSKFTEWQA